MIINLRSKMMFENGQNGSALVTLLFLIVILAILLMNADTVSDLATAPVYNFETQKNVRQIVKVVNSYKVANGGNLPQSDADIEGVLKKSLFDLGLAGASYTLYYTSDQVTIKGISPTTKTYTSTVSGSN
ncbi:MAG TPA: hypothetical protein PKN87_09675 [Syntrophomonadaceae bacterium]|nr:hypothetical protein [Syntrophomonadaceae bacterium]HPR94262.1 hypothetical protein [Syntrophomonadaceae bacterium]